MATRVTVSLALFIAIILQSCRRTPVMTAADKIRLPELTEKSYERSADRIVLTGSWRPQPTGWSPYASVRIECVRLQNDCTEFWASYVADEDHGGPGALVPDVTHYSISMWTPETIAAHGVFRRKWPVDLRIDVKSGETTRQYTSSADRSDGSAYWTLR